MCVCVCVCVCVYVYVFFFIIIMACPITVRSTTCWVCTYIWYVVSSCAGLLFLVV